MSKMAKIFWNEAAAMVLSCGIILFYSFILKMTAMESYSLTAVIMAIIAIITRFEISFSASYLITGEMALLICCSKIFLNNRLIGLIFLFFSLMIGAAILIAAYKERKIGHLKIAYSLLCYSATIVIIFKFLLNSWLISLVSGIVGTSIMAAIMFIPSDFFADFKPHLPNHNGLAG